MESDTVFQYRMFHRPLARIWASCRLYGCNVGNVSCNIWPLQVSTAHCEICGLSLLTLSLILRQIDGSTFYGRP